MLLKLLKWIRIKIEEYERRNFRRIGTKLSKQYVDMFRKVKKSRVKMDEAIDFENEYLKQMALNQHIILNEKILSQDRIVLNLYLRNLLQLDKHVVENLSIDKNTYLAKTRISRVESNHTVEIVTNNDGNPVKETSSPNTI